MLCDPKGVPMGYDLVGPKTGEERESVFSLATAHPESMLIGLAQRIAKRLLALTLGIFCNTLAGRPPRALAAYDGR